VELAQDRVMVLGVLNVRDLLPES